MKPLVMIGHRGVSDSVVEQVAECLETHELIKVKVGAECPLDRDEVAAALAERTASDVAGEIGRVIILYRSRANNPTIQLPTASATEALE